MADNNENTHLNTRHNNSDELIGIVVDENGTTTIRDLYSDDNLYFLEKHSNTIPLSTGSIIHGQVQKGIVSLVALLASPNTIQASLYSIAAKHKLNPLFSNAIMQEVDVILANPGLNDPFLVDMAEKAFCTIDGADTRDLDQALYIEDISSEKQDARYRVYYALADAAYYVRPGTKLFEEALKRGSSYYLPGLMIPMLPRSLCEGLVSLNEKVIRRATVFELSLDFAGVCINTRIFKARIKSRAKLSFEKVQAFLDSQNNNVNGDVALGNSLKLLHTVGELRLQLADERNIVRYRRHEVDVKLGTNGCRYIILDRLRNDVEQYNEQLSLLCNVEGARFLRKEDTEEDHVHPIYRVHPQPPQSQIKAFEQLLQSLIQIHNLDPAQWSWCLGQQQTLADYLKNLPLSGLESRIAQAIHRQAIMINVRSSFSEEAAQHYGVGADVYARFSAPMREIVGVFLHKELAEKQSDILPISSKKEDDVLRKKIIKIANQAKIIQRKITQEGNLLVLNQMFEDDFQCLSDERPRHQGTVIGLDKRKLYVLLDNPKIEVKVYISHLDAVLNTTLLLNDEKVILNRGDIEKPFIRLGDSVSLYVKGKDKSQDRWVLVFDQS